MGAPGESWKTRILIEMQWTDHVPEVSDGNKELSRGQSRTDCQKCCLCFALYPDSIAVAKFLSNNLFVRVNLKMA